MKPASHRPVIVPAAPGFVRIIGGLWKRSKLAVPARPGLRPTPDRVRETLFNWLGQDLTGLRCLDAFAGSGALGFEAASRGAVQVLLCEQDPGLAAGLRANAERLKATQIKVQRGDAIATLKGASRGSWDLVFLDPPFGDNGNEALFTQALQAAVLASSAVNRMFEYRRVIPGMTWLSEELGQRARVGLINRGLSETGGDRSYRRHDGLAAAG